MAARKRKRCDSTGSDSKSQISSQMDRDESTSPSLISMKSKRSMFEPICFADKSKGVPGSAAPSFVSMKSDKSMFEPIQFQTETQRELSGESSSCAAGEHEEDLVPLSCGHRSETSGSGQSCQQCGKKPSRTEGDAGDEHRFNAKKNLKEEMKRKFAYVSEGNGDQPSPLSSIYTNLYITRGERAEPDAKRESTRSKQTLRKQRSHETTVKLSDIFKSSSGLENPTRTALTEGVAGIGKSFAVQKFVLDWAEEQTNQDVDFLFCLAFRELNLSQGEKSLHRLLTDFHPALSDLKAPETYVQSKVMVILDGLDESRLQLDFSNAEVLSSVSAVAPLGHLLVNLIQGHLLPSAKLWITSRPAASGQIPAKYIDAVTEIRGFSDPQKEEYFRRRFHHDSSVAERIVSHVQSSLSLNIMCQIPIFCWISAVFFEDVFTDDKGKIPQTLTEMMAHFLFAQTRRRSRKYDDEPEENDEKLLERHREFLLRLGKLAFVHLQKNNLIFYEDDLEECGIDVREASVYSGFYNAVLREEDLSSQRKVFFFVHLTIQEFFAALYVYDCLLDSNKAETTAEIHSFLHLKDVKLDLLDLLKRTVDKVLEKQNGLLHFFLRFLLGLLVEQNRRVLQGLLTAPAPGHDADKKILTYLRSIRRKTVSPDSCVSLFQAMVEMRDHKIKDEIQEYLTLSDRSATELSPLHCSALAYMLQVSKDLEVLDLKSYNTSEEGRRRLIPAVKISRKATLSDCKVTGEWIEHLVLTLKLPYSRIRDLDLSNNDLQDSGVDLLCGGLAHQCCRLHTLRLSGCQVTEKGCDHLALALKSNPSHLVELDLSYNHPGASGEKLLSKLRDDPQYRLSKVNVDHGGSHRMRSGFKKYACELTFDPNTAHENLLLSEDSRKVSWAPEQQPCPRHADRFDQCQQVLSQQGLDGRCYFELEVLEPFSIGLTYRTIGRKGGGNDCKLGHNDASWSFTSSSEGCFALHGERKVSVVSHCSRSSRVGVYLDWPAGTLSFYRVSADSRTRLHTFTATFTEPLYAAVELHSHSNVLICH